MNSEYAIEAKSVRKSYRNGEKSLNVLRSIDLEVEKGDFVSIQGESGCGKTTLLNILSGIETPDQGFVKWNGRELSGLGRNGLAVLRGQYLGIVFQNFYLVPELSVLQNVLLGIRITKVFGKKESLERAQDILRRVGLGDRFAQVPATLSGGEKQRVAIARALVADPVAILADEPTGNLDERTGNAVMDLLVELCQEKCVTMLLVTHNQEHAARANRSLSIRDGILE